MYLRHTTIRKDGKVHRHWRLVRSVRVGRRVIQQTVAQLGELDEHGRIEARALARRLIGAPEQTALFDDGSEHLTVPVRLKGIRIERSRQFGDVYLALALWRGTGLEELCQQLLPAGQERIAWAKMAAVLVAAAKRPRQVEREDERRRRVGGVLSVEQRHGADHCGAPQVASPANTGIRSGVIWPRSQADRSTGASREGSGF